MISQSNCGLYGEIYTCSQFAYRDMRDIFKLSVLAGVLWGGALADDAEDSFRVGVGEIAASAGLGYRENALYSEILPIDSSFAYAAVEGGMQKDFISSGAEWVTMFMLDNRSYLSRSDLPDETFGMLMSEFGKYATIDGRVALEFQYVYLSQAFDASFDIEEENRIHLRIQEPGLFLKWNSFFWKFEYEATVGASRMYFQDSTNDYETIDWELEAAHKIDDQSLFFLSANGFARDYTDRNARDLDGFSISDSRLGTDRVAFEAGYERSFQIGELEGVWELEGIYRQRRDRHSGYYDRDRIKLGMEGELRGEKWTLYADIYYSQSEYLNQISDDGALRRSDEWVWELEIDRQLNDRWSAFTRINSEISDSNESFFSYRTNSVLLGISYR